MNQYFLGKKRKEGEGKRKSDSDSDSKKLKPQAGKERALKKGKKEEKKTKKGEKRLFGILFQKSLSAAPPHKI